MEDEMGRTQGAVNIHPQIRGARPVIVVFLSPHASRQFSPPQVVIYLRDISNIERIDLKPYCLLLESKDKRFYLSLKGDEELYGWQDDIYARTPMGASIPTNFVHKIHVGFDPVTGAFTVRVCACCPLPHRPAHAPHPGHARSVGQTAHKVQHHKGRLRKGPAGRARRARVLHGPPEARAGGSRRATSL